MSTQTPIKELTISRTFDAPRALVYQAWTEARHVANWFAPDIFEVPECTWDAVPGGTLYLVMEGMGARFPMSGVFQEVVPQEKLVFTAATMFDEDGVPAIENITTVTFADAAGKTAVTVYQAVTKAGPGSEFPLAGMDEGWKQTIAKLEGYVASLVGGAQ
jgi:uncharacterized protein YndB with AHSA1/START domain